MSRTVASVLAILFSVAVLAPAGPISRAQDRAIIKTEIKGAIGVGTGHHISEALAEAKSRNAHLLIVQIDTPGGLVAATRDIISEILNAPVPVAVFIAPSGARAASAGTFITYAAHIAAAAPGTHLGAATPIPMGAPGLPGTPANDPGDKDNKKSSEPSPAKSAQMKSVNDAVAYIRSLAQLRGRNAEWAEKAVRDANTLTATEALKERVIDVLAEDTAGLLVQIDGRTVTTTLGPVTLQTRGASVIDFEPTWKTQLLSIITDPNVAFILLMIGIYGILFEFWSPGLAGPGVIGAISLVIALMALSTLPVSVAGLALLLLGVALMSGEAVAPGFGILGIGGIIAFIIGAVFLFDPSGADIDFSVAWPVVIGAAATSALLFIGVLGMAVRASRKSVVTGDEGLIGSDAQVVSWSNNDGRIRVHGEIWSATSNNPLAPGARVTVIARNGLTLEVVPSGERSS